MSSTGTFGNVGNCRIESLCITPLTDPLVWESVSAKRKLPDVPVPVPSSPAQYLVLHCYAYNIAKTSYRTCPAKTGESGPLWIQSNEANDSINYHLIIGVARGVQWMHLHPPGRWKKNFRRNLQGKCVSAPPGHEVHPKPDQESLLGHFLIFARWVRFGNIFKPSFDGDD